MDLSLNDAFRFVWTCIHPVVAHLPWIEPGGNRGELRREARSLLN